MPNLLELSQSRERNNNLNALRLAFATLVIVSHSFALTVNEPDPLGWLSRGQTDFGKVAVDGFFFISGMLITASWLKSRNMSDFFLRRVLRIYPGFAVAIMITLLVDYLANADFRHNVPWHEGLEQAFCDAFLLSNSSTVNVNLFATNFAPGSANGSLWTIPSEFNCYMVVAAVGLFCLYKYRRLLLVICSAAYLYSLIYLMHKVVPVIGNDPVNVMSWYICFFAGMMAWLWRDKIPINHWLAGFCLLVLVVGARVAPLFHVGFPLAGGYLVLYLGYARIWPACQWCNRTDLSYGVYLYAFLIQQVLAKSVVLRQPWIIMLLATPLAYGMGWLSWTFVEKRFLVLKRIELTDHDPATLH